MTHISRVIGVWGRLAQDRTFVGAEDHLRARGVAVVNLQSRECIDLMADFISKYPEIWNEDIGK